jgi:hypothetical protein
VMVCSGIQGGLSSTVDSGQFSALSFEECVVGDSIVDTSSERHEVAPQQDCDQESRHLTGQLRVSEDMIMEPLDALMIHTHWWQVIVGGS